MTDQEIQELEELILYKYFHNAKTAEGIVEAYSDFGSSMTTLFAVAAITVGITDKQGIDTIVGMFVSEVEKKILAILDSNNKGTIH